MGKLYLCLIGILLPYALTAQNTNMVWAMSYQIGIDFNVSPPVAIATSVFTYEGSASISDANGQLLMYTAGNVLYNRNHQPMPNGSGLLGLPQPATSRSCTQASLIVPMPGSTTKYYIFALAGYETSSAMPGGSLWYSIADMSLDNGLGDVIAGQKTILLEDSLQEKMTAVGGCNNNVWVVVRPRLADEFRAFEVTTTGVNTQPVVSPTSAAGNQLDDYMAGVIKFSPDGKKMVSVNNNYTNVWRAGVLLFDFDKTTGTLSNLVQLATSADIIMPYGACFSPDNTKLYITENMHELWQYDLSLPTLPAIISSKTSLGVNADYRVGDMQIGPDGKIYLSNLDAIEYPNIAGAGCSYVHDAIALNGLSGNVMYGLPNAVINPVMASAVAPTVSLSDTAICAGTLSKMNISASVSGAQNALFQWGPPGVILSSNNGTAVINPALSDNIYLTITNGGTGNSCNVGSASDTMHITQKGCGCEVYLPNAFSPNQDGHNDLFAVQTSGSACTGNLKYTLSIYNRWGERVYREADNGHGWNGSYKGKPADAGTYYFYLEYLPGDGAVKGTRKGDLALIR